MNELYLTLGKIQKELKAPKGQTNDFGHYRYRSCEDILEAVKPHLKDLALTISDEVVAVGDRHYIKAIAKISNGKDEITNTAWAREPLTKKGMDEAQITGATSSYARKYALNGLFCIDDTRDADTQDNRDESRLEYATKEQIAELKQNGRTPEALAVYFKEEKLTKASAEKALKAIRQKAKEKEAS
ncbi:MAG: ERF family protein [Elusimicrobiota bacterium]|jgi:hypothetical protein|nr:ERF family protein [Elusimicrobiota bacterium]